MNPRVLNGILITIAILLWAVLLFFQEMDAMVSIVEGSGLVNRFGYRVALVAFMLTNILLFDRLFSQIEKLHVTGMLWRLFLIGMIGITLVMIITFANRSLREFELSYRYIAPAMFRMGLDVMLVFFLSGVFIFRRFILYPRTKRKILFWRIFLGFLGLALLITLDGNTYLSGYFRLPVYIVFALVVLGLSINARWISYLNFNQKLRALGLFVMILIVSVTYIIALVQLPGLLNVQQSAILQYEFLLHIILFVVVYCVFSILGLFFNLPTASIFERESSQIISFENINQAIQSNLDFSDIMNTTLDMNMLASGAKVGWVEMFNEQNGQAEIKLTKKITVEEIQELTQDAQLSKKVLDEAQAYLIRNTRRHKLLRSGQSRFKCLLAVPILSSSKTYGVIFMANELENSFEDVSIESATIYAKQAGIALENARLVKDSIEVERYKEQLKIAQEVQTQLLPKQLPYDPCVEFAAMSETAYEVGGDYYDVLQPWPNVYRVAIGDVSGKGTTAAFYMAEIKGIFHALGHLKMKVRDFLSTANLALSECMQKGFFMTITYLQIDTEKRQIEMLRAGHCPAFYYSAKEDKISQLRSGTLGIGIVRDKSFDKYVPPAEQINYEPGDVMLLYTDGIQEARNAEKEEFGYDRIHAVFDQYKQESAQDLASNIVESVKNFTHTDLQDDYTVLVIRFRK